MDYSALGIGMVQLLKGPEFQLTSKLYISE